jgi:hypothetical protein
MARSEFTENLGNKIGRITTSGILTEYPVPTPNSVPDGIASGPDGALWFTEHDVDKIGRITTAGVITEYAIASSTGPTSITALPDGALWFTLESGRNGLGRITTSGLVTEYPVPHPFHPGSSLNGIAAGPDHMAWFTDAGHNAIGQAPACGLGLSAGYAKGVVTVNFELGIDRPATWTVEVGKTSRTRKIGAVAPPRVFTLHFKAPAAGSVRVQSKLTDPSGHVLCSEWTTVDTVPR